MQHDVFISHSSIDKSAADTIYSTLEQNSIHCWIAPRDIIPGVPFAEAIIDAIKESKVFILIYSANSNHSSQVIKEVGRAVHHGLSIITLHLGKTVTPLAGTGSQKYSWKKTAIPVTVIITILVVALLVISLLLKQKIYSSESVMYKSIAVLPFDNLSNDPEQEYFSDGMMDEILDRLFKIGELKVILRTSSMRYKNSSLSLKKILFSPWHTVDAQGYGQVFSRWV